MIIEKIIVETRNNPNVAKEEFTKLIGINSMIIDNNMLENKFNKKFSMQEILAYYKRENYKSKFIT